MPNKHFAKWVLNTKGSVGAKGREEKFDRTVLGVIVFLKLFDLYLITLLIILGSYNVVFCVNFTCEIYEVENLEQVSFYLFFKIFSSSPVIAALTLAHRPVDEDAVQLLRFLI